MALKRIRLELGRTREFPEGSDKHGYEFVAPLRPDGHLDEQEWKKYRQACTVHRFWQNEEDEVGQLMRSRQGQWYFSYKRGREDDEPIFRFDTHVFQQGEYVSVTEHDGVTRPFRVAAVEPAIPN